jgi:hypothetical protein
MGVYIGLKESRRKQVQKPSTIKVFVDLPEPHGLECAQHCAKELRRELNEFYTDYFLDVVIGKGKDDYTPVYDVEGDPHRVVEVIESMASYVEHVMDEPDAWCRCDKEE